jgi:hypothetical protein
MEPSDVVMRLAHRAAGRRAAELGIDPPELLGEAWIQAYQVTKGGKCPRPTRDVMERLEPDTDGKTEVHVEPDNPQERAEAANLVEVLHRLIRELKPMEAATICVVNGLGEHEPTTYEQAGRIIGNNLTRESYRRYEQMGLRRLLHPSRLPALCSLIDRDSRILRPYWAYGEGIPGTHGRGRSVWESTRPQAWTYPSGLDGRGIFDGLPLGRHGSASSLVAAVLRASPEIRGPRINPEVRLVDGSIVVDRTWTIPQGELPAPRALRLDVDDGMDIADVESRLADHLLGEMRPVIDPVRLDTPCPAALFARGLCPDPRPDLADGVWHRVQAATASRLLLDALRGYDPERYALDAARRAVRLHASPEAATSRRREELIKRYLHGECMVLAASLSRRFGLETVGVYDRTWNTVPRHVGVMVSEGRYADARGTSLTRFEFLSGYQHDGSTHIRPISAEQMEQIWSHRVGWWDVPDEHLAMLGLDQRSFAADILDSRLTSASLRASNG